MPRILTIGLSLFVVVAVAFTAFSMRTLFYDLGVREVVIGDARAGDVPGRRFDRVLLDQLEVFEYIRSFDHLFRRHRADTPPSGTTLAKPLHVDRCEVRQGDFYRFVQWQKTNPGKAIAAPAQPVHWVYQSNSHKHAVSGRLKAPANGVGYYDAYGYCKAAGGRLPYSDEWIAFAAGGGNRLYPWGDEFNQFNWPYLDPLMNAAQNCGLHRQTNTPGGIHDMGGVVSEWAQNRHEPLKPTIHGGNAYNQPRQLYSLNALYRHAPPEYRSPYLGFRCVYATRPLQTPWQTRLNTVLVPAGDYPAGIPADARLPSLIAHLPRKQLHVLKRLFDSGEPNGNSNPTPKKLFVMQHEVTREQYRAFLRDPLVRFGLYADKNEPRDHNYRPPDWDEQIKQPQLPVVNVDWWSAYAFAVWAGGRLPAAEEWIAAASGRGRRVYPWGNTFESGHAIGGEAELRSAQHAGSVATDQSMDGIFEMAGNVSEWTQSIDVSDGGYIIVTKGGNYLLPGRETARIDFKNAVPPNHRSPALGIRVVFDRRL